ncbi:MAG: hypothetical protein AB8C13_10915 [Phycisphaerales bacterium]
MSLTQAGPTELFLPEGFVAQQAADSGFVIWVGLAIVAILIAGVCLRAMSQRRVDASELAFRALSKRLRLSKGQVASLQKFAEVSGQRPVGLLMSPSAVRSAAQIQQDD